MTYNDLYRALSQMTDSERMQTVTVHLAFEDEFYPVNSDLMKSDSTNDVLDPGHFYLVVE